MKKPGWHQLKQAFLFDSPTSAITSTRKLQITVIFMNARTMHFLQPNTNQALHASCYPYAADVHGSRAANVAWHSICLLD